MPGPQRRGRTESGVAPEPSRWGERISVAVAAAAGLAVSLYLAAHQLGAVAAPWDPLFGRRGGRRVDAALQATAKATASRTGRSTSLVDETELGGPRRRSTARRTAPTRSRR